MLTQPGPALACELCALRAALQSYGVAVLSCARLAPNGFALKLVEFGG